ncbi:hypothetical protein HPB48_005169 [Haemaphysalis longicornis]|uniref:Cadherin domain-containing protein n=1 Tax=Haemaphysalis longicornis TaxID=44386 RepID=A0A9J6F7B7_HAELO|nr:hypothetical protein HPB48_005169 [Haemaphysalis longicornis]
MLRTRPEKAYCLCQERGNLTENVPRLGPVLAVGKSRERSLHKWLPEIARCAKAVAAIQTSPPVRLAGRGQWEVRVTEPRLPRWALAETDQATHPRDLPVAGDVQDIELSIQSASHDVFQLLGKRLILKRPLDRDAEDLASIRLQVLCQARLGRVQLAPVGTTIFRDLATMDMDTGTNGLVEYTTVPGDGTDNDGYDYFAIDLPYQGLVTIARPLDYEKAKYYHLLVKATDTASNPADRLSSTTTLTVFIEDGDDQDPAFAHERCSVVHGACADVEYSAEVTSGLISGILKIYPEEIRAEDRDSLKSKIQYSFVNGTPSFYREFFDIDRDSGFVRQLKAVDRTLAKSFQIIVKAEEDNESRRFATARLTIGVRVVDSNPPILLASATEGFVDENAAVGTYVVTQPGGDEPLYFMVSDDDIVVAHQANAEPGKGSSAPISLSVRLNDVNDNSPKLPSLSPVTIQAGDGVRNVTQVLARDDDEGEFARVSYSVYHVSNNGRDKFRIDPNTGVVQVISKVFSGDQYSITVQATDSGGRFSQGILDVIVIPGPNTGGPVFSKEKYDAQVSEGASVGSAVLTLKATDPEGDEVSYSIVEGNNQGVFTIDSSSGTVSVAKRLNREEVALYTLQIKAEDKNNLVKEASSWHFTLLVLN